MGDNGAVLRAPRYSLEYQPKWWFKASGVLDDSEVFPWRMRSRVNDEMAAAIQ